jgi:hypothetical protein
MAAVEVVVGVHRWPGLGLGGQAVIEAPVDARTVEVEQAGAVDTDAGDGGQSPVGPSSVGTD